jgi:hypothetical protein
MTIGSHIKTFAGRTVREFPPQKEVGDDPATIAWRAWRTQTSRAVRSSSSGSSS